MPLIDPITTMNPIVRRSWMGVALALVFGGLFLGAALPLVLFSSGCTSLIGEDEPDHHVLPVPPATSRSAAVAIALTRVDPVAYDGWSGPLRFPPLDARRVVLACAEYQIPITVLQDQAATWESILAACLAAVQGFERGDLLIVSYSGHGGQLPDDNGDEQDGFDETWIAYNGPVRDDRVFAELLRRLPAGIRVAMISDQCHGATAFRGQPLLDEIEIGRAGAWDGQLIQLAGSTEAGYAYESSAGGRWTQTLFGALSGRPSWRGWFNVCYPMMPPEQPTVWVEFGQVTDSFRNAPAMR